jgi:phosphate transporter
MEAGPKRLASLTDPLLASGPFSDFSSLTERSPTPAFRPRLKPRQTFLPLIGAALFSLVYAIPIMKSHPTGHSTLAVLVLVTFLWATEGIPVYATAYVVPILAVWLGIGLDANEQRLPGDERAKIFARQFMNPVIFVFMGCMTLVLALSKLNITGRLSVFVFKKLPHNPRLMLLTLMVLNVVTSS